MNLKVPSVLNEHSKSPLALQKGGTSFFLVVCLVELLALAKAPPVFWSKLFFFQKQLVMDLWPKEVPTTFSSLKILTSTT